MISQNMTRAISTATTETQLNNAVKTTIYKQPTNNVVSATILPQVRNNISKEDERDNALQNNARQSKMELNVDTCRLMFEDRLKEYARQQLVEKEIFTHRMNQLETKARHLSKQIFWSYVALTVLLILCMCIHSSQNKLKYDLLWNMYMCTSNRHMIV